MYPNAEQTYVALMYRASSYYATWDPIRPITLGDYGYIRNNYSFEKEGNIFNDRLAEEFDISIVDGGEDSERWIVSVATKEQTLSVNIGVPKATIKKSFSITRSCGAILAMLRPRHQSLTGPLRDLIYSTAFTDERVLVSEVYSCSSYARLLVPRQKGSVEISLDITESQAHILHGTVEGKWRTSAESGDFKFLHEREQADYKARPLVRLLGRSRGRWGKKRPVETLPPPAWRRIAMRHVRGCGLDEGFDGEESDYDDVML
ncbi:uncharacterized protein LAESUDRAFT_722126 [Laetiporus sulphureus 93-53]|uniref:Uncharacterized protein n=1 Tax=Laetiporus sulphureus 93-53 TaxID=1314785 RepID=A0A165G8N1_9APHY|nr:uncharacterized protein LAESUDRAFT_722126 [Laetiporus sulphureus 93-53]KZT09983.1 hypothetical protein LAESUDRAFT_722126 [Laetiporus sulphureus 93-53]